jgi:dolichol kinase
MRSGNNRRLAGTVTAAGVVTLVTVTVEVEVMMPAHVVVLGAMGATVIVSWRVVVTVNVCVVLMNVYQVGMSAVPVGRG